MKHQSIPQSMGEYLALPDEQKSRLALPIMDDADACRADHAAEVARLRAENAELQSALDRARASDAAQLKRAVAMQESRDEMWAALNGLVAAEESFTRETEIPLSDPITDAIEIARAALGKAAR